MFFRSGIRSILVFLSFFYIQTNSLFAQRIEFGAGLGTTLYKGDLTPFFNPLFVKPAFQALFRYNFSMAAVGRVNLMYGGLKAEGASSTNLYIAQKKPNAFNTPLIELTAGAEYNFFNFRSPKNKFIIGTPYLVGAIGAFYFSPAATEAKGNVLPVQPVISFGVGYKRKLGNNLNFNVEFSARPTFTDFLDNVSDREVASPYQRGEKFNKDWYMFLGFNITYTIREIICPFIYQDELPGQPPTK